MLMKIKDNSVFSIINSVFLFWTQKIRKDIKSSTNRWFKQCNKCLPNEDLNHNSWTHKRSKMCPDWHWNGFLVRQMKWSHWDTATDRQRQSLDIPRRCEKWVSIRIEKNEKKLLETSKQFSFNTFNIHNATQTASESTTSRALGTIWEPWKSSGPCETSAWPESAQAKSERVLRF